LAWRAYANQIQVGFEHAGQVTLQSTWRLPGGEHRELELPERKVPATVLDFTFTLHGHGFPVSGFNFVTVCLMERHEDRHQPTTTTLLATLDVEKTDLWRARSGKDLVNQLLHLDQHSRSGSVVKALLDNARKTVRA